MSRYRKYFTRSIGKTFPADFEKIIDDTDRHYRDFSVDTAFAKASDNLLDKRLDFSSYFLALIKTLDEKGESFDSIRKICLEITIDYVRPKNMIQEFFKRQIPKLTNTWFGQRLIRSLHRRVSVNKNPDGFIANIITDKQDTLGFGYGIDIIECGICKLFNKHNFAKYAPLLCEVDKITSGMSGLKLIRTGTIANGAEKCDFRFQYVNGYSLR